MSLENSKAIVLSGFARGGTNIVWNILQSHPGVVAPPNETGYLFRRTPKLWLCTKAFKLAQGYMTEAINNSLQQRKMSSLKHYDNRYVSEDLLYTPEQMRKSLLCLKSVNHDIDLTELLAEVYPDLFFIGLSRNGYALADGYIRRGKTAKEAGKLYQSMADKMQKISESIDYFKLIKFEDVLINPFSEAENLFKFLQLNPTSINKIRLKSKRVIGVDGSHEVKLGDENRKYWFNEDTIGQILDSTVNQKQADRLSHEDQKTFTQEARSALEYFGYEVAG